MTFSQRSADFFASSNWLSLDSTDADLGGSGPVLVRAVGATPSQLIVALGKDGEAYLIDQARMGGIGAALARRRVSSSPIINAAAAYTTAQGTYVVFTGSGIGCPGGHVGDLTAIKINATSPAEHSPARADILGRGAEGQLCETVPHLRGPRCRP